MSALNDPEAVLFEPFVEDDDPSGLTEDEAYAFLAGADASTSTLPPIIAAANMEHTGAMIALGKSAA